MRLTLPHALSPNVKVWRRTADNSVTGALIGFAGAIGALGGVFINVVLRASYVGAAKATSAFWVFLGFYVICAVVTWFVFLRNPDRQGRRG
jgi:MFS transporter, NNP family, nitrate/nitrite transporter